MHASAPGSPAAEATRRNQAAKGSNRTRLQQQRRRAREAALATQRYEREHGPALAPAMLRAAGLAAGHVF